jgi:hypothetical protein
MGVDQYGWMDLYEIRRVGWICLRRVMTPCIYYCIIGRGDRVHGAGHMLYGWFAAWS